ncbi:MULTISPECIES: DUF397 domain-containing protein [unclassified Streptomyces]|uniref:DUF397 domain-containing protein n=1 Tax=unclassified Streptomyces TaxID=2593676 RepID=UPI002DD7B46E|nr:DUF397 domain-containing protein [Streptomyces sp. NBC_01237]WRZ74445.1 DUF397 domain-containing protein [Streptomyces sp. NBC_01237]
MISETSAGDGYALEWFKSSYSDSSNSNECVEIATTRVTVHVRDSKNAHGPRLAVSRAAWTGFVSYAAGN